MIRCTTIGREPSELCYEICVIATKCGALKAWGKEQTMSDERAIEQLEHDMLYEPSFNAEDGSM